MGTRTRISWADSTFNPWIGCAKVNRARTSADTWRKPRQWNRKAALDGTMPRVFCASLADVFEDHPALSEWRADLWRLIDQTRCLQWMLLTKRPENIAAMLPDNWADGWSHVWLGTTVENQARADDRVPELMQAPAALHFLLLEPMLGPIDLNGLMRTPCEQGCGTDVTCSALTASTTCGCCIEGPECITWPGIGWVITGGESGTGDRIRPSHPDWFRSIRDQCVDAEVPYFHKQWGEWAPTGWDADPPREVRSMYTPSNESAWVGDLSYLMIGDQLHHLERMARVGKKAAGRLLDGREWSQIPTPAPVAGQADLFGGTRV